MELELETWYLSLSLLDGCLAKNNLKFNFQCFLFFK